MKRPDPAHVLLEKEREDEQVLDAALAGAAIEGGCFDIVPGKVHVMRSLLDDMSIIDNFAVN